MRQFKFAVFVKLKRDDAWVSQQWVAATTRKKATAKVLGKHPSLIHVATVPEGAYYRLCNQYNGGWPPMREVKKL